MKGCDSEWNSFRTRTWPRRWYRGGGLPVRKYSQFLPTVVAAQGRQHGPADLSLVSMGLLLFPEDQDSSHHQVANELIPSVDGEELHALFGEKSARELHCGDKAEPNVEAGHHAEVE